MFPYRVNYNESEYDIQNDDLLYKIHPKHQTTFEMLENIGNYIKPKITNKYIIVYFVICISYTTQISIIFVFVGNVGSLYFLYFYIIYIYIYTCRSLILALYIFCFPFG